MSVTSSQLASAFSTGAVTAGATSTSEAPAFAASARFFIVRPSWIAPPPSTRNAKCGMFGIRPSMTMIEPVMISTRGFVNSCPVSCVPMSSSVATRETITPAAVEMTSDGICATRPSPIVSSV
jgi:hypothetical protein